MDSGLAEDSASQLRYDNIDIPFLLSRLVISA
jgi:hypothetical protein